MKIEEKSGKRLGFQGRVAHTIKSIFRRWDIIILIIFSVIFSWRFGEYLQFLHKEFFIDKFLDFLTIIFGFYLASLSLITIEERRTFLETPKDIKLVSFVVKAFYKTVQNIFILILWVLLTIAFNLNPSKNFFVGAAWIFLLASAFFRIFLSLVMFWKLLEETLLKDYREIINAEIKNENKEKRSLMKNLIEKV